MGYTHYFWRVPAINRDAFSQAVDDVRLIIDAARAKGVLLAGPTGIGQPDLGDNLIALNGARQCGHRYADLGKPWPAKTAEGIIGPGDDPIVGPWFGGALLKARACGGSCAQMPFVLDREFIVRTWDVPEGGMYFSMCETDYKPYDLAVTASLVRIKERLGDEFIVSSDGQDRGFDDAKRMCRELFGWPTRFELRRPKEPETVT